MILCTSGTCCRPLPRSGDGDGYTRAWNADERGTLMAHTEKETYGSYPTDAFDNPAERTCGGAPAAAGRWRCVWRRS